MYLVSLGIDRAKQILLIADGADWYGLHIPAKLGIYASKVTVNFGWAALVLRQVRSLLMPLISTSGVTTELLKVPLKFEIRK